MEFIYFYLPFLLWVGHYVVKENFFPGQYLFALLRGPGAMIGGYWWQGRYADICTIIFSLPHIYPNTILFPFLEMGLG